MKRGTKLLALGLALAVLAGGYALATKLNSESDLVEEETETVTAFAVEADSVTALSWDYGEGALTFLRTEETWAYEDDPDFAVDGDALDQALSAVAQIAAVKTISDPQDLSQYGLDHPACTVTVTAEETFTLTFGDETALDGDRYFTTGDGAVYLVDTSVLNCFPADLSSLAAEEET